jgi:hypothetical protein
MSKYTSSPCVYVPTLVICGTCGARVDVVVVGGGDTGAGDDFAVEGPVEDPTAVDVDDLVTGDPEDPEGDVIGEAGDPVPGDGESKVGDGGSENDCTARAWSAALGW